MSVVTLKHCEMCGCLFTRLDQRVYCVPCTPRPTAVRTEVRVWVPPSRDAVWNQLARQVDALG